MRRHLSVFRMEKLFLLNKLFVTKSSKVLHFRLLTMKLISVQSFASSEAQSTLLVTEKVLKIKWSCVHRRSSCRIHCILMRGSNYMLYLWRLGNEWNADKYHQYVSLNGVYSRLFPVAVKSNRLAVDGGEIVARHLQIGKYVARFEWRHISTCKSMKNDRALSYVWNRTFSSTITLKTDMLHSDII